MLTKEPILHYTALLSIVRPNRQGLTGDEQSSLFRPTVSDEMFDEIDTWKLDSGASSFEHGRQKGRQSCTEIRVKRHFIKLRFVKQHFVYLPVFIVKKYTSG